MSTIQRKLQAQVDGLLLAAIATLLLIACAAPAKPQAIIITDGARFAPATLSGRVGEAIIWHNRSQDRHSIVVGPASADSRAGVAADGAEELRSGELFHNQRWSHTFERAGSYRFTCTIHEGEDMVGVLTVVEY